MRFGRVEIPLTAVIGLLGTVAVWVDVVLTKPAGRNLGFFWMGIGIVMYLWYRRTQRLSPTARVELEKLRMPDYEEVHIKKILVPRAFAGHNEIMQFAGAPWRWLPRSGRALPAWLGAFAVRAAQRAAERLHSRARRDLLRWDEQLDTALAFSGRSE